ncbi:hypothetical protein [Glycomyces sp. NPDC047010]|uniref:hypothetical protein n=1 Tax=Glycomyces sp. NPDC047010 TaxID=3155023 RepID=UPI0033DB904F
MHEPTTATAEPDTGPLVPPEVTRARARAFALAPMLSLAAIIGCISLAVAAATLAVADPTGPPRPVLVCGILSLLFGLGAYAAFVGTMKLLVEVVEDLDQWEWNRWRNRSAS